MRLIIACLAALTLLGQPAPAQEQTPDPTETQDREAALARHFQTLRAARNPGEAQQAEQKIWRIWMQGPTEDATSQLQVGVNFIRLGRFEEAVATFDGLIDAHPDFTEAWNQRAFAYFLAEKFEASLADIEETLAREPRHFGALAGKARILARRGDAEAAARVMGEAGQVNPWMARLSPIPATPRPPRPEEFEDL